MHINIRSSKYLLLSTQLFLKFSVTEIATNKCASYRQLCQTCLQLRSRGIISSKQTVITNVTLAWQYKYLCSHLWQTFEVNPVPARPFYICAGHPSRTISSSTVSDSTVTGAEMSQFAVVHDKDKKCFYIKLEEASSDQPEVLAKLEYEWVQPGLVEMFHTEVPPQHQGKGIAKVLATAAFDAFSEQGVQMRPTCTYLQKYLRDNQIPRYLEHIEKGFVL
ncbi:unnamed protein product [Candidula unifasciata]|uniref:Protein NATD1 n=1 Tax=Candidula unifasciata TaxID=100452 RepID=A0A8S3Z9S2_9EUPU|nr:unnamed protein product [Candidula unifasciata]